MTFPSGPSFPFRFSNSGSVTRSEEATKVMDNLRCIVKTPIRSRLIRKGVGTISYELILRPSIQTGIPIIKSLLREAFAKFEPRALILDISITETEENDGTAMKIEVPFVFKSTGEGVTLETIIE